jgi:hypothetical protein
VDSILTSLRVRSIGSMGMLVQDKPDEEHIAACG